MMVHATDHERARQLMLQLRAESLPSGPRSWLEGHVAICVSCSETYAEMDQAIHALRVRQGQITASRSLVRATQMRMRERAAELRSEEERMSPLWIATALAAIWAVLSAPFLWYGFEWVGAHSQLPALIWQTLFAFAWLMPTGLIAAFALWTKGARSIRS